MKCTPAPTDLRSLSQNRINFCDLTEEQKEQLKGQLYAALADLVASDDSPSTDPGDTPAECCDPEELRGELLTDAFGVPMGYLLPL